MYPQPHITQTVSTHFEAMATPIHRSVVPGSCCVTWHLMSEVKPHNLRQFTAASLNTLQTCVQLFKNFTW